MTTRKKAVAFLLFAVTFGMFGSLLVKATASDTIERSITATNTIIPEIYLKARLIEVEQDGAFNWYLSNFVSGTVLANGESPSKMPISATNPLATITGVLTDPNFHVVLHALELRPGFKTLAEPEVVTSNGRQTQIRETAQTGAGAIVNLVPNLLSDGYTINLKAMVTAPVSLSAQVNMHDGQTVVLSKAEKSSDKQLIVLVTATIVDPVGNRVHSADNLPFNPLLIPPQPK